jgi:hypothetical protein
MKRFILSAVLTAALAAGVWAQDDSSDGPNVLGSSRSALLADIGKPLDEIKDKGTLKGLYDSILVAKDPTEDLPTAALYFLSHGVSVDYVVMKFYTPEHVDALQGDKEAIDATITEKGFEAQEVAGLPDGQALYYSAESKEFVFLADDDAQGNVKVVFLAYTADNKTLGPLSQIIPAVISKVQKDLKL